MSDLILGSGATAQVSVAVLDDDPDFRQYVEDFLSGEKIYTVRSFAHPEELYLACEEEAPEILLLDMKMGPERGEQVLERIKSRFPQVCVIVVTGFPSLEDMRLTFKLKVFDYLTKPFTLTQFRQVLRHAIEAHGLGRAPAELLRERLGHEIKMLRVARGWSLKDLASACGLSISQVSSIERGANLPSVESMLAICRAFGKKPSEVLAAIGF